MLTVRGVEGHVAYPHLARNPIQTFAPVLVELYDQQLDAGNEFFPPSSFQVVSIESESGAPNVTPGQLIARLNFRYSTEWDHEGLKAHIEKFLSDRGLDFSIDWHLSGEPFLTEGGKLTEAVTAAVHAVTGLEPDLSTGGGTSDGRFISPMGAQVVEFGAVNATIHKPNEQVPLADIDLMLRTYSNILERLLR
jgi:succinyl-diaminopimelate desuccinylase